MNDSVGWAAGQAIHKTIDGGETWTLQKRIADVGSWGPDVGSCYFINEKKGWLGVQLYTLDGGENWDSINNEPVGCFCFINDTTGFGLREGELYKTTIGGILTSIDNAIVNSSHLSFELKQIPY